MDWCFQPEEEKTGKGEQQRQNKMNGLQKGITIS